MTGPRRNLGACAALLLLAVTAGTTGDTELRHSGYRFGRGSEQMADGAAGLETRLIVAAAYNVAALVTSTVLSVYKPGRRCR